jgi:hypothetical protein
LPTILNRMIVFIIIVESLLAPFMKDRLRCLFSQSLS